MIRNLHLQDSPISVILFFVILACGLAAFINRKIFMNLFFHPHSIVWNRQYYRLFSSDLVHVNWVHLAINLFMLYAGCVGLEAFLSKESTVGHLIFSAVYLICHFSGIIVVTLRHYKDFEFSSAGASGSIMGCLFCFMVIQPDVVAFYLPIFGPVKNIFAGLIFILLLIRLQFKDNKMYNHELHFYSAVTGLAIGAILRNWLRAGSPI